MFNLIVMCKIYDIDPALVVTKGSRCGDEPTFTPGEQTRKLVLRNTRQDASVQLCQLFIHSLLV